MGGRDLRVWGGRSRRLGRAASRRAVGFDALLNPALPPEGLAQAMGHRSPACGGLRRGLGAAQSLAGLLLKLNLPGGGLGDKML